MVKFLLDAGIDPNSCNDSAFLRGCLNYDITKLLIDYGADVTVQNNEALKRAVCNKNYEIVKLLIDNGADPNAINQIEINSVSTNEKLVPYLMENGVDPIILLKIWQ